METITTKLQEVYTIIDTKAGTYSRPMFAQKKGVMLRQFQDIANDKQHPIGQHPEDYVLYKIGTWDEDKGIITPCEHESLGKALDYIKE